MNQLQEENAFFRNRLSSLEPLLSLKQKQIDAVLEVTRAINQNIPIDALVRILEAVIYAQLGINKWVLVIKNNEGDWQCISNMGIDDEQMKKKNIEVFISRYEHLGQISTIDSNPDFSHVIPVINKDTKIAFAFMGGFEYEENNDFNDRLKFVQTITNMICVAHENKRLYEQEVEQKLQKKDIILASMIQSVLVPRSFPAHEKFKVSALYKPFREIGGDYYDFIECSDGEYFMCMCDISGKGIAAAMIMSNFQANLRLTIKKGSSMPQIIAELNQSVYEVTRGDAFITGFFAKYDVKNNSLNYINAGHNPPILVQSNVTHELGVGCSILGAIKKLPSIIADTVYLNPDDFLVMYTDGLTEASDYDDNYYGSDTLKKFAVDNKREDVEFFIIRLIQNIQKFSGKDMFDDDISLMCIKFS
jgi:sigma-B regulation protein RsbU (phosphoserine phosphatase)